MCLNNNIQHLITRCNANVADCLIERAPDRAEVLYGIACKVSIHLPSSHSVVSESFSERVVVDF